MTASIKAFAFDIDGTVYAFNDKYLKACTKALKPGLFANRDAVESAREEVAYHGLHDGGMMSREAAKLVRDARHRLKADFIDASQNPDFRAPLQALSDAGIGLYTFSYSREKWCQQVLEKRGIADLIPPDHRITPEQGDFNKGHPSAYTYLAQRIGCAPGEILYWDDKARHCKAAEEAGLFAVTVNFRTGIEPADLNMAYQTILQPGS